MSATLRRILLCLWPTLAAAAGPPLVDVAADRGLLFEHGAGSTGHFYFPEIAGSGGALFDYDGDGDLDVYAVQGTPLDAPPDSAGSNRLFRNDLRDGVPRFVDVTHAAGVGDRGYGMGCAVGDYDNDGDDDLFVTNYGEDVLYVNNGNGTFARSAWDATPRDEHQRAIERLDRWSTSATFVDYDRDGLLDLYVCRYVRFVPEHNPPCHSRSSRRDYCGPESFDPSPDRLYRNQGDGTFIDVTARSGIDRAQGSSLGVVASDFNADGWPDIAVAVDGRANHLWMNQGDGRFIDTALLAGVAYNAEGVPEAGMGITAGDFDEDGDDDLLLSHLVGEHNTLLVNDGGGLFDDRTTAFGLGAVSRAYTGFGVRWFDLEGDGDLDFLVANGAVKIDEHVANHAFPYQQPNQLILNGGAPRFTFTDHSESSAALLTPHVSRGAAFGDVDNDGDEDIVVFNSNGPVQLLHNTAGDQATWWVCRLRRRGHRPALGAVVTLEGDDGRIRRRSVQRGGSYLCAHDGRVRFALRDGRAYRAVVTWPGGAIERFDVTRGAEQMLVEGQGQASSAGPAVVKRPVPPPAVTADAAPPGRARATPADFPISNLSASVRQQIDAARSAVDRDADSAAAHAYLGMVCHTYELFNAAIASYERAVALDDAHPQWFYYLALASSHTGSFDRAAGALDHILMRTPDDVPTLLERGEVALRQGDDATAEMMFRRALLGSAQPAARATAQCGLGRALHRSGRNAEAAAVLQQALTSVPDYALALYALAHIERDRGALAAAQHHAELAERYAGRRPEYTDPWIEALRALAGGPIHALHEGIDLMQAGRFEAALPLLQRATQERSDLAEAHAHLGACLLKLGRVREAMTELNAAVALNASYADAHYHLGVGARDQDQLHAAAEHFRRALAVRPDHLDARYGLALCSVDHGDRPAAVAELGRVITLGPQDPRAPKTLARLLVADGRCGEAVAVLTAAVERLPDDLTLINRAAWLLATCSDDAVRDGARALLWAKQVCEQTRYSEARTLDTLAAAQAETGDYAAAVTTAEKARSIAHARGQQAYAEVLAERLQMYRDGTPYRLAAPRSSSTTEQH